MEIWIVLYEHYLQDHFVEVIGVFEKKTMADEAWEKSMKNRNFRDECWVVERKLNDFSNKTGY